MFYSILICLYVLLKEPENRIPKGKEIQHCVCVYPKKSLSLTEKPENNRVYLDHIYQPLSAWEVSQYCYFISHSNFYWYFNVSNTAFEP